MSSRRSRAFLKVICVGDSGSKLFVAELTLFKKKHACYKASLISCLLALQELERQLCCIKLCSTSSAPATEPQLAQTFSNTTLKLRCVNAAKMLNSCALDSALYDLERDYTLTLY
jgi:hypothetical protein